MARPWSDRWNRLKQDVTWTDLAADVIGKILMGLGAGALLAAYVQPYGWCLIGTGLIVSLVVKAKYWKRFWA